MPDNTQPITSTIQQPEERMRTSLPTRWQDRETVKLDPAMVKRVQKSTYMHAKDFGNMTKQGKYDALYDVLTDKRPSFAEVPQDKQDQFIKSLLDNMGEFETYSVKEAVIDMAGPVIGAAGGSLAAGPAGAILGGGAGAMVSEAIKANLERHKRGIPSMSLEEMVETGVPPAIAEMLFGLGGPLLGRIKLAGARKMLLPGGPFKGNVKNLSREIIDAQDILGQTQVERKGIYAALTDRLRYGRGGARSSLSVQQLNEAEENFVSNMSELVGSGMLVTGTVKKRATEAFDVANSYMLKTVDKMSTDLEPHYVGKFVRDAVDGKIQLSGGIRDTLWAEARVALNRANGSRGIPVSTASLDSWFNNPTAGVLLKKERKALDRAIQSITGSKGLPPSIDATQALDLWHLFNSLRDNKKVGTAARKLAPLIRKDLFNATSRAGRADAQSTKAYDALVSARNFQIGHGETFNNKLIKSLLSSLRDKPALIEDFVLKGGTARVDNILALRKAMPLNAFESKVLPPLRFSFFKDTTTSVPKHGKVISGSAIVKKLKDYGLTFKDDGSISEVGRYLETVFGSKQKVKDLYRNAMAIEQTLGGATGSKILMKIAEATAVMGVANRPIREVGGMATMVLLSPLALSSGILTNRRMARELTQGTMGHKPIEQALMTVVRLVEQAGKFDGMKRWTQDQITTFSEFFEKSLHEVGDNAPQQ